MTRGRFHFVCGLLAYALACAGPGAAGSRPDKAFSIVLDAPYRGVSDAVREVCSDGVIHGSEQYESEIGIAGAEAAGSSRAFPPWTGEGEAVYKTRPKTIAPSTFRGSRDIGTVTLRYIVEPVGPARTRLTIEAVFVEESHHGLHRSEGIVEAAEFTEIAKRLRPPSAGAAARPQQAQNAGSKD